ncbi:hypothetical protein [Caloramator sp. Dgby_cultured_2]|uniref:hypothetical protein n=1 Tax=Caloramator sp. Dgby_cultured_2 TaxID=3029174 RepID=UPI00237DB2CC|nr:hypothetical protein [Caloramator sp. Dgby_cultured_2]WDU82311.1 hypothetical protein PWK10_11485 [Caloramator sp. Dgby_cultured_2]
MPKVRVIKCKRQNNFEHQKYRILINDKDVSSYFYEVSTRVSVEDTFLTEVTLKLKTNDFQWLSEE